MAQSVQLKNDTFLDSSSVNWNRYILKDMLNEHLVGGPPNIMMNIRQDNAITGVDLDNYNNPGIYSLYGVCVNAPLNGQAMHDGYGTLTVVAYSSSHVTQILQAAKWNGTCNKVWIRSKDGGNQTWQAWETIQVTPGEGGQEIDWFTIRDCFAGRFQAGSGDNYLVIRTPVHAYTQSFNRIKIEGYAYRNQSPLHVELCWYNYNNSGTWMPINHGWFGVGPDDVKLGMHSDASGAFNWIQIHMPADNYFTFFVITELSSSQRSSVYRPKTQWHAYASASAASFSAYTITVQRRT